VKVKHNSYFNTDTIKLTQIEQAKVF